ncbi:hypothetical protein EVAR_52253_1 [Eumeta japonica]|uniref:Endonuclease/exonuclease/phosphatase domain-containing protein n=1 Tax=Eumeta variegata TaxID=151549 RepID=A0A4C1YQM4_EUMVA|nr:hypothetical protein EVAR_52253_1 [Eumeta japonica]
MPRFWAHESCLRGKTATCSYCADKTHEWEKCPRRKQNEEPKCKNCWENGIKLRPTTRPLATNASWRQRKDIDSLGSGTLCRKPRHPKTKSRHQNNTVHCRPPEASESGDNCFGDKVEVLHDPQLVTETESAVLLKIGRMKLGIISIYFEGDEDIEPYIIRTEKACKNLGTENLIIADDINAWSHWWGSQR